MKAAINGVPHLSIGDGWWAEGFNGTNGWVIDGGASGDDYDAIDAADAAALYRLLEEEIVPAFYDRDAGRRAAPVARDRQGGDPLRGAALLGAPHGQGVRGAMYAPALEHSKSEV